MIIDATSLTIIVRLRTKNRNRRSHSAHAQYRRSYGKPLFAPSTDKHLKPVIAFHSHLIWTVPTKHHLLWMRTVLQHINVSPSTRAECELCCHTQPHALLSPLMFDADCAAAHHRLPLSLCLICSTSLYPHPPMLDADCAAPRHLPLSTPHSLVFKRRCAATATIPWPRPPPTRAHS